MRPHSPSAATRNCRSTCSAFSSGARCRGSWPVKMRARWCTSELDAKGEEGMIAELKKNTEVKMKKTLEALKNDLGKVRTGRAHTGLLDHVTVDYYGTPTPIPQLANVTLVDARTI